MRFLAILNLILYICLSIHAFSDGHAQVLCIGAHGHIAIETLEVAQTEQDKSETCNLDRAHDPCPDCHDILLGDGHGDHTPLASDVQLMLPAFENLQVLSPILLTLPAAGKALPEPVAPHPPPVHTATTVLLI